MILNVKNFQLIRVVTNMLELFNASMNFYIYFVCNRELRAHFCDMVLAFARKWKNNDSEFLEEQSVSRITTVTTNMRRRISTVSSEFTDLMNRPRRKSIPVSIPTAASATSAVASASFSPRT